MTVYFAQTRIDQHTIKIGYTSNVAARKSSMSTSVPGGVVFVAEMDGGPDVEQYLHERFAIHRIGGEWFYYVDEIRDFVRSVQNKTQIVLPIKETTSRVHRETSNYSADAVIVAKGMADEILRKEFRGPGDTMEAAMFRLQTRCGISATVFKRLRHRDLKDIWSGEFMHLKEIYELTFATVQELRDEQ